MTSYDPSLPAAKKPKRLRRIWGKRWGKFIKNIYLIPIFIKIKDVNLSKKFGTVCYWIIVESSSATGGT